ncbi:MAG: ABC transporter ATP-binding protein [Verrucomicrobiota bacterium]
MPADPAPDDRAATLRRLLRIAWSYRADCLQLLGLQLAGVFLTVAVIALAGVGIDFIRHCADRTVAAPALPFFVPADASDRAVLAWLGAGIFVAALARAALSFAFGLVSVRFLHGRIVVNLRAQVFAKLQQLSFRFFDGNASGSIINRVTSDAHAVRIFIEGVLLQLAIIAVTLVACSAYMFRTDWRLSLACLSVLPFQVWFAVRFSRRVRPAYEENRELMDRMVLGFSENVQGIQVVKGFALEPRIQARFAGWSEAIRVQKRKVFGEIALFWPVIDGLNRLSMAILLGYGGWMVARGEIALGTGLVAFAGLLQQFSAQVTTLAAVVDNAQVSLAGAKRIFEILDTAPGVASAPGARSPGRFLGRVAFEDVSFEYQDNATVLRGLSFVAEPGRRIAIAGATGAGKSALLSLIPRFYDPRSGRVTLDGHDLRELPLPELRRQVGIVFQENFLFSYTIAANIACGHPEATLERIERAARIAGAHEFIAALPEGYETHLGEGGVNLSGGQRQRLAIARALLLEPTVLLLDVPTSAIDAETENEIMAAMEAAMVGRTTFIVAHRLSTLRRADLILVLDHGRLIQAGTHAELMAKDGHYRRAILVQSEGAAA